MFTTELMASATQGGGEGGNPMGMFIPMIIIMGLFWFMIVRPQSKQQKTRQKMLKELKEGDKVLTVGGIYATIQKLEDEDKLVLKIGEGVNVKATRQSVEKKLD